MDAGDVARVRAWLAREAADELYPGAVASLAAAWPDGAPPRVRRRSGGTLVAFQSETGTPRRVLELDPSGVALAWLHWGDAGRLEEAALRLPDRSWVLVEPRASREAPWGLSDRLWHGRTPDRGANSRALSLFAAVDYGAVRKIPALAEPSRLPPGAGTVVLNLLGSLAEDQGASRVVYDGPYPTEALFLALQESFLFEGAPENSLEMFLAGALTWRPAPHERRFVADGCYVQIRERIDKVVWRRRTYYRAVWQGIGRHAPRRVRDVRGGTRCSLWALGRPIEDHLELDDTGEVRRILLSPTAPAPVRRIPDAVVVGLVAAVAATSAPPLGPFIREQADELTLEWGAIEGDLLAVAGSRIRLSARLRDAAREAPHTTSESSAEDPTSRAAAPTPGRDHGLPASALALFVELTSLLGDELRARAQARLLAQPPDEQVRALAAANPTPAASTADEITTAVGALLGDVADV